MIKVTRLNGTSYTINALFIETVESHPDTTITLTNGKKLVVKEKEEDIIHSVIQFYRLANVIGIRREEDISEYEK
ncbi:flagellar FlbD family protein [Peribacillus loiseleuriae]|uniref:flagellar FlbD family protein n=1 Tax=Peribacillus loiseleuriae TaxID=1679170 RepID=UPI0037F78698